MTRVESQTTDSSAKDRLGNVIGNTAHLAVDPVEDLREVLDIGGEGSLLTRRSDHGPSVGRQCRAPGRVSRSGHQFGRTAMRLLLELNLNQI